jgi:hypothetical protein
MAQLFARVELRGTPDESVYERLHAHMGSLNWLRTIDGFTETGDQITKTLPHATYQANSVSDNPLPLAIAQELRSGIESQIWTAVIVLVIRSANWGQAG